MIVCVFFAADLHYPISYNIKFFVFVPRRQYRLFAGFCYYMNQRKRATLILFEYDFRLLSVFLLYFLDMINEKFGTPLKNV